MKKQQAIQSIKESKPLLSRRFGVSRLALFCSTARNTATDTSDIDTLVSFDGPATSTCYFGVQFYLEDLLGCPLELATKKGLRQELRLYVKHEAIDV